MRTFGYILLVGCTFLLCHSSCRQARIEENATAFSMTDTMMKICRFSEVRVEPVKSELRLFGKINADNSRLAQVYPVVGGNVISIRVELGDYVEQGQVLAELRSQDVALFEKELLDAKSDVALAEKNLNVKQELFLAKLNSESELNAARKELEKANAELVRIKEVYSIYQLKGGSVFQITAPISGFIVSKNINQNEQLRSDNASSIFSIAQIDVVWMMANVNESDVSKVKTGYDAEIKTVSYPDTIFSGKIDRIFNVIDPETKAMKVLVKIPNPARLLKPEMSATMTVKFEEGKALPAIPSSAVIFDKNKNWVMIFKDRNNIETRQVEVYRQTGTTSYIQSGIKPGEKVISGNGLLIYDALND